MSVTKLDEKLYKVRWREGGRARSVIVHGSAKLAKKIQDKKLTLRAENRHLDVKKQINYRMDDLIDKYWTQYGVKKRSADREKSIVEGIRAALGRMFVREVDGMAVQEWYDNLTDVRELAVNTAERHFHVMHHMMRKASTIWATVTGIDRNPADQVEVEHVDDTRKRYLSEEEFPRLMVALDERMYRKGTKDINKTNLRLRLLVLIAVGTGMRRGEIFRLEWRDILYNEGLIVVRAKLKKGTIRHVPLSPELAEEIRRYPAVLGEDRILPPEPGATSGRQRADKSLRELLERAEIRDFRFHDLRHTFASWYMMSGGDIYELSKLLGHSNIKMTERYADLARAHIVKTGSVSREIWGKLKPQSEGREIAETGQQKLEQTA
ncbi:MAG: site-specific integrase [Acidobacteriota bacterium]|nr:site-specific integrase [Acidobacteriota bacterium]